jgi:hypothetical protein
MEYVRYNLQASSLLYTFVSPALGLAQGEGCRSSRMEARETKQIVIAL